MAEHVCDECGSETEAARPHVDRYEDTTHWESRAGSAIDHIVIHYTTSRNIEGTISWFKQAPIGKRTSAHYIVGRDGVLVCMVADNRAAWHAGSKDMNRRSIGIEHVAAAGDALTEAQSDKSLALIRWLVEAYDIPRENIVPHKHVKPTTDCCGDLLKDHDATRASSAGQQKAAIDRWLATADL